MQGIAHNDNTWVAVGASGTIYASEDNGNTWVAKNSGIGDIHLHSICLVDNKWVAVGDRGTVITSIDAAVWA